MLSDDVRKVLIVLLFGAAGVAVWSYVHQRQLQRGQFSLRALLLLSVFFAVAVCLGLTFIDFWKELGNILD